MDFLRSCYSTTMQFDEAGEITADVRWYWASPGAKLWSGHNAFCSANWDEAPYSYVGLGEIWNAPRTYSKGEAPYPSPGTGRWCGKHHWFAEGAPSEAPSLIRGPSGQPFCCGGSPGLLIGGNSSLAAVYQGYGGVLLGGSSLVPTLCQPWYNAGYPSGTLYREMTSTYLPVFVVGSGYIEFEGIISPFNIFTADENLSGPSCSGQHPTALYLSVTGSPLNPLALALVSYNPASYTGRWQVPLTAALYAGEYFDFYCPP